MADHRLAFEVDGSQAAAGVAKFEKELDRAIAAAARFHSALDKTFGRATNSAVSGLNALSNALTSLYKAGSAAKSVDSLSRALSKLSNIKSSASELRKFISTISSIQVPASFNNIVKALNSIGSAANRATKSLMAMNNSLNSNQIKSFINATNNAQRSVRGMTTAAQAMGGTLLGMGLVEVGQRILDFGKNVFNTAASMVKFTATMRAATGSLKGVDDGLAFIRNLTQSLGTPLLESAERFSKFAIASQTAGASMADTEKIFEAMSVALTAVGANSQDASLAFLAIEQMMSKGRVSAEELRRQLAERIPGAFGLMANALKVSTSELDRMLRAGQVLSKDALPKLADELLRVFSPALETSLKGPVVALGRLKNAFTELMIIVGQSGFIQALTTQMNALAESISSPSFKQFASAIGQIGTVLVNVLGVGLRIVTDNIFIMTPLIVLLSLRVVSMAASFFNLNGALSLFNIGLLTTGRNATVASAGLGALNIQTARTNMLMNASALGIGRLGAAAGMFGRTVGMLVPAFRAFIIALTIFTALAPAIEHMLTSLGLVPTYIMSAAQASIQLKTALDTASLSGEKAAEIFVGLKFGLKANQEAAMKAAEAVLYYRSVWTGWLIRHKTELDGVTASLVELSRKFSTGALSATDLSIALKKIDLKGASEGTRELYEKLVTLAVESKASQVELTRLASAIQSVRDKAKTAGQDTQTYDMLLSKLKQKSDSAGQSQQALAQKTKQAGNEFDIASIKSAKYASKLDAVNAKFNALNQGGVKAQSWAAKMRRANLDLESSFDGISSASTNTDSKIDSVSGSMASGAQQASNYARAINQASDSVATLGKNLNAAAIPNIVGPNAQIPDTAKTSSKSYSIASVGGKVNPGLVQLFESAISELGGAGSVTGSGFGSKLDVSYLPEEFKSLLKGVNTSRAGTTDSVEASIKKFLDNYNAFKNEKEAEQNVTVNTDSSSIDANTAALNANTTAVGGLGTEYSDLLNKLYNRLDLARQNLSSYYSDPSSIWNSDKKGVSTIPGYADGFKGVVGGASGVDKNMMVARVSRGEGVEVTPKSEMKNGTFPSDRIGGVTMNVYANDAASFVRNESKVKSALARAVQSAQRSGRV